MNTNIIKENLSSFIFVAIIMCGGFYYIIEENKVLQKEKLIINNEKNEIELMKKDLDNKILQGKLDFKDNLKIISDLQKENNSEIQKYEVSINKKDLEIQNLRKIINNKDNEIVNLNISNSELKIDKEELIKQIGMMNKAEKITGLISEFSKKYSAIDKNTYDKYSDYIQVVREYEGIIGLINSYKLNYEYENFIRNMNKKLYVDK
ncbi:hypothetical protein [Aliarcobacter cryaerophilus]|uniref:hypothetical protein n=1 Tax=Aliarcobacter cryaerophilus TaxID=28198 RepID=UPI0011E009A8|nr:hypothetical protein [Aliarcobacter cryaerophilus]